MSEMPEYTEQQIRERNIRQFAANERAESIARLQRENQHLRDFICKSLGRPFVEMADEGKEVWR